MVSSLKIRTRRDAVARWRFDAVCAQPHAKPNSEFACISPIEVFAFGYPDALTSGLGLEAGGPLAHKFDARCRKCAGCLRHRSRLWTARAVDEVAAAQRTWFGTLTLHPDHAFRFRLLAERRLTRGGSSFSDLEPDVRTQEIAQEVGPDLQRFLKRARKNTGARLRYLLVCEAHKSGVPHWHILLHESEGKASKRSLEECWRLGFSQWRLADEGSAFYVCKYLAKSAMARVRASQRYGRPFTVLHPASANGAVAQPKASRNPPPV